MPTESFFVEVTKLLSAAIFLTSDLERSPRGKMALLRSCPVT